MRKANIFLFLTLFILFSLFIATIFSNLETTEAAAIANNSHFVRIPSDSQIDHLNLNPRQEIDYQSFIWLELADTDYHKLVNSGLTYTELPDAGKVQVVHYQFDPVIEGEPRLAENMTSSSKEAGFHLVQFIGPAKDNWLANLQATGLTLLQYYPHNTYLVWGTQTEVQAAAALTQVRWQGDFHPAYKVDNYLRTFTGTISNVDIMFYNDGDIEATLAAIKALGGNILQHYPSQPDKAFYDAIVQLDVSALDDVAQIATVLWLGHLSPKPILDDEMSSQILAGNHPGGVPTTGYNTHLANLGYDGSGVTWAVIDTGVDYDHPDLNTHIVGGYQFSGACNTGNPGEDCSIGGHGTHVAGIIGGDAAAGFTDANGFLYGLGVAPGHGIFAMNSLSAPSWPPAGGWQEHSKQAVLGGAIGGNNSWTTGEGTNHGYQASERTHDIMVRDGNFDTTNVAEPFIEVFSAGNSGPGISTLTAPKESKNLIVTASSLNFRAGDINNLSGFSSRGPAVDGRWVPTIASPGDTIASTRNDTGGVCATSIPGTNNLYAFCSGTSMAAPHTSGAVVLMTEWWRTFNGNADPSPAMAKALLVNGAIDMGTADIPNINEGWGRVNVTNIISSPVPVIYYDQTTTFGNTGEQWAISLGIADTSQPLRVTLAWSDAPGAVGANPALVNNLDLTVQNGGNTYSGNLFSGGWSTTGGTADSINNLENVYIQNPGSSAVITIDATSINGDAVPYNADTTDQDFALVCSNCNLLQDFTLSATPNTQTICTPTDALYDITVGSNLGYNDIVFLSSAGAPAATTTTFSANNLAAPYTTTLTIGNTGAATAGSYMIDIVGMGPTTTHTATVGLDLNTAVPNAPTLLAPANAASNVPTLPTFSWSPSNQGSSYFLEIAADPAFNTIVYSTTTTSTSHPLPSANELNTNTTYHWRVRASNACGTGNDSAVFTFITEPVPGDCGPGAQPQIIYSEDMESGAPGWTHTAGQGSDTWTLSGTNPHSGSMAFHADDLPTVSDQYLDSPAVALPNGEAPLTLKFWNYQELEDSPGGCYDGAVLEVSTNGGGSWTRLDSELLTDPYDGPISSGFSNPLAGQNAWCGDPQAYLNSIVDIDAYAGQTVQFRFRLATDSLVGHPGWDIDDVVVQSCELTDPAIAVDPESLSSSQSADIQVTVPMTISNSGGSALTWDIVEDSGTAVLLPLDNNQVHQTISDNDTQAASCAAPSAVPWVTVSPISGTIPGLSSTTVDVIFDSTGYAGGIYTSTLCVNSNDPINPLISVPLTMTVPTNQAPAAANDIYSTNQDTALTVTAPGVLGNDTDEDGGTLTAVLGNNPSHGSLSLSANGSFTYTPDPGFEGNDTFTYQADDGTNISNVATVTITVLNTAPIAISDAYSTTEDAALTVPAPGVLSNDTDADNDALTAVLDSDVANGTLTMNANGSFTYTPASGFVGLDSFTYHTNDGTDDSNVVTVTINIVGLSTVEIYIPFVITE